MNVLCLRMYACVCVCACACACACVCVCVCVCMYVCMCVCMYVCMCVCVCMCVVSVCVNVCAYAHVCSSVCLCLWLSVFRLCLPALPLECLQAYLNDSKRIRICSSLCSSVFLPLSVYLTQENQLPTANALRHMPRMLNGFSDRRCVESGHTAVQLRYKESGL